MSEEQLKSQKKWIVLSCASIVTILAIVAFQGLTKPTLSIKADHARENELMALIETKEAEYHLVMEEKLKEISDYQLAVQRLEEEIAEFSKEPQVLVLEKRIEDLADKMSRREEEQAGYEQRIWEKEQEIAALEERVGDVEALTAEVAEKGARLAKLEAMSREAEAVKTELGTIRQERDTMALAAKRNEEMIASLQEMVAGYKEGMAGLEECTDALKKEVADLQAEKESMALSSTRNGELISSLQETVVSYKSTLSEAERFCQQVQTEFESLKMERDRSLQENKGLVSIVREKEEAMTRLGGELGELRRHFEKMSNLAIARGEALEEARGEGAALKKALADNAELIGALQEKMGQREETMRAALAIEEKNKELLKKEIGKLTQEKEQLTARNGDLNQRFEISQEKLAACAVFEDKYREERKQRLIKEQLLKQLQAHLDGQRNDLEKIEKSRVALAEELDYTQRSYSQLAEQAAKVLPAPGVQASKDAQTHIVQQGETLMHISQKYYGTTKKWKRIFEANRDVLASEDKMQPGLALMIP